MVSLADHLGMQDYHTLYDDGVNSALKAKRPNPNQLLIGDEWNDPPKGKVFPKPVDQAHTFVVKAKQPPKLRIVLVDADAKPLAGKDWKLTAPKALSGKTKGDGLIEVPDLPFQAKAGTLEVTWQHTQPKKAAPPAPDPKIAKPTYPRPILPREFTDDPVPAPSPADDVVEFTLKIGSLPPHTVDSGVRSRLHNLGYGCGRGSDANSTKQCVSAFQSGFLKQKTPSGLWKDISNDLHTKHDNP